MLVQFDNNARDNLITLYRVVIVSRCLDSPHPTCFNGFPDFLSPHLHFAGSLSVFPPHLYFTGSPDVSSPHLHFAGSLSVFSPHLCFTGSPDVSSPTSILLVLLAFPHPSSILLVPLEFPHTTSILLVILAFTYPSLVLILFPGFVWLASDLIERSQSDIPDFDVCMTVFDSSIDTMFLMSFKTIIKVMSVPRKTISLL